MDRVQHRLYFLCHLLIDLKEKSMRMMKRLTITLLALLFAVSLITGCSKVEDTTLEGTWRITESTIGGLKVTYPMDIEFTGITMTIQPYIQLKNNVYAEITKTTIDTEVSWDITEGTYSVNGNTLIVTIEEEEQQYTFVISGKKLNLTSTDDGISIGTKAVKVPDSEVAGAFAEE